MIIPWPDLAEHIRQSRVDAILTTYETVKSAKLWETGVQSVFEDRQYFPQYIPLVRASFWERLSADIQQVIMDTWEENMEDSRRMAAKSQQQAKEVLVENGETIFVPDPGEVDSWRNQLLFLQPDFVLHTGIDPELVRQVSEAL
jgi:C4-dicarboxylate-binding protein DctP